MMSSDYKFYVYELWNPIKNEPFYVGKASYDRDRLSEHIKEAKFNKHKRKKSHKINTILSILSYDEKVEERIIFETDDESEAFKFESEMIKIHGRRCDGTGVLTNLTLGGEGARGLPFTNEMRLACSKRMSGVGNPMFGKAHSGKTKEKISKTRKRRIKTGKILPTKHTEEHKKKLRSNNPGGMAMAKSVWQIDPETGNCLRQYSSIQNAAKSIGGLKSNIAQCCKQYKNRVAYGYYWRLVGDSDIIEGKLSNIDLLNKKRFGSPIIQLDDDGNIVRYWDKIKDATEYFGCGVSTIGWAIKNKKKTQGFYWGKL
jgi:group I intron endonuclease